MTICQVDLSAKDLKSFTLGHLSVNSGPSIQLLIKSLLGSDLRGLLKSQTGK